MTKPFEPLLKGQYYQLRNGLKAQIVEALDYPQGDEDVRSHFVALSYQFAPDLACQVRLGLLFVNRDGICQHFNGSGEDCSQWDIVDLWREKVVFDRSLLPDWMNAAIAQDDDGNWHCYESVPTWEGKFRIWSGGGARLLIPRHHHPAAWNGDAIQSLLVFEDA